MNTELLFPSSSVFIVANWCCQFGLTEEEKGRVGIPVDKKILTMVEPEEVELLVSPPTQAPGNRMQGSALTFKNTGKYTVYTTVWKSLLQHLVTAGNYHKIQPNADDGWGTVTPLCREYSSSRSYPKTKALAAIPEGTTIGPVLEVHFVKILDGYGIEVAIQSIAHPYIQRNRAFCEWNSWSQTRAQVQQWIAPKPSRTRKKWRKKSKQKPQGNLSVSKHEGILCRPYHLYSKKGIPIHRKNHSYEWEKVESHSCSFTRWRRFGSVIFQGGHKNVSSFLTRRTTNWWRFDWTSVDESVSTSRSTKFWWWFLVTPDSWWQYQETARILPRRRWEFMLFPSYSGTLCRCSNKSKLDE